MKTFNIKTVQQVMDELVNHFQGKYIKTETIPTWTAHRRILAEDVFAQFRVPDFNRSTVDGFAVHAADTSGASDSMPMLLDVIGKVEMGRPTGLRIGPGQAAYVPTGGMVPEGADAMVMIEYTESLDEETLACNSAVAVKENVVYAGEDIEAGMMLLSKGCALRPQDIGALAAQGISQVTVFKRPVLAIISTGDELVDLTEELGEGCVRDINTYTLEAEALALGMEIGSKRIVKDVRSEIEEAVKSAYESSDIVVVSGGSSVGEKDETSEIIDNLGQPGVFVHGMAIKPGKPTIVADVEGKPVVGLPGHPVSALLVFKLLMRCLLSEAYGIAVPRESVVSAVMSQAVHSAQGKAHYQMVKLSNAEDAGGKITAVPVHGKSGLITLLTQADGYIIIGTDQEGLSKGESVDVRLF